MTLLRAAAFEKGLLYIILKINSECSPLSHIHPFSSCEKKKGFKVLCVEYAEELLQVGRKMFSEISKTCEN